MASIIRAPCDEGIIRAAAASTPVAGRQWTLVVAVLGSSMAFMDGTIATVALPAIARDLSATVVQLQWVIESYSLLLSSLVLAGGSLGDHFGRRRIFGIGVAIFAAASAGCGMSQTMGQLIGLRAIQGAGAALLVPGSLALISAAYPAQDRGRAIGTWSGFSGITAAMGPILGGWLIEHESWRWAFFINLPIAVIVIAVLWRKIGESRDPHATGRIDWAGAVLVSTGLGGLVYGFIEIPGRGWGSPIVLVSLAGGVVALAVFAWVESVIASPMLPLNLFRSRAFTGANLLTLLLYAALGGALFFLPLNLIQVQGYSATAAGASLVPFIAIMFALSRWAGGLVARFGPRRPLIAGPVVAAAGFALLGVPGVGGVYWRTFFPGIVVLGFGMVMTVAPLTTTVMSSAGETRAGVASGINNAVARTAGLLAVAVLGIVVGTIFSSRLETRLSAQPVSASVRQAILEQRTRWAGAQVPSSVSADVRTGIRRDIDESFVAGVRVAMLASAAFALLGAASAAVFVR